MPLPAELLVPGFLVEGSVKFHVRTDCTGLKAMKAVPAPSTLPLERFSKAATCQNCCSVHRDVGNAYRRLVSEGLSSSYPEDVDQLVVLETNQAFLPLPPVLGTFLEAGPEFEVRQPSTSGRSGFRAPSIRRVPAWVACWASLYSAAASAGHDRNRFRPHLYPVLALSEAHVRAAATIWQAGMLQEADNLEYFQYASLVAAVLIDREGLEKVSAAAQLWLESLESDGPIDTLPRALEAVELLTQ